MYDNSQVSDITPIKPGVRVEGCRLVKITKVNDPGKNTHGAVTFHFIQDKTKAVLNHMEFAPKKGEKQTDEKFAAQVKLQGSRIAHITRAYLVEDVAKTIGGANWDEYIKNTVTALGVDFNTGVPSKTVNVIVALKVVLRDNKYSSLPNVPVFISSDLNPKDFTINPEYDKFVPEMAQPDAARASNVATFDAPPATQQAAVNDFGAGATPSSTAHPSGF